MRIRWWKSAKEAVTSNLLAISFNVKKEEIKDFDKKNLNKNRRNFGQSTAAASTSGLGRGLYVILKGLAVYLKCDSFPSSRNLLIFVTKWPFNKRQRILMNKRPRKNASLNPRDEEDYTSY